MAAPAKKPTPQGKPEILGAAFDKAVKGTPDVGYLLYGDEDYLKNHAIASMRTVLCPDPSFEPFNYMRFDAMTYSAEALSRALQPPPMMADRKLVVVTGLCPGSMKADDLDELCEVLSTLPDYDYNVLLLVVPAGGMETDNQNKTKALMARLAATLTPVRYDHVGTDRLMGWMMRHFDKDGIACDEPVLRSILNRCGQDMYRLSFEIDKLACYLLENGRNVVTPADVTLVTSETVSFGAFALSNALMDRRTDEALRILEERKKQKEEPVFLLGEITRIFCDLLRVSTLAAVCPDDKAIAAASGLSAGKIAVMRRSLRGATPERLREVLDACAAADVEIKSSYNDFGPLETLVCKL